MTCALVSLGCAKNLVESEVMLADLALAGAALTGDYADADVLIVNTCGFLQLAQREAADTIDELTAYKAPAGRCRCLVVAGCWSQIASAEILARWPAVDLVIGVNDRRRLVGAVGRVLGRDGCRVTRVSTRTGRLPREATRLRLTPRHWAYLRISEGCSQGCSFCTIPRIRGRHRSKPEGQVLAEARALVEDGAHELVLIGQETTSYGRDLGRGRNLARLLDRLNQVPGLDWIRLMYAYPAHFSTAVMDAIARLDHVVKYVDMPLQHISDPVLARMNRGVTRSATEALLGKLRDRVPGLVLRTTMMVGFPGETEAEFRELIEFVKAFPFDALGAFVFSPEPGTKAARLPGQVDEATKQARLDELMRTQQRIAFRRAKAWVGRRFDVYVEGPADRPGWLVARHSGQGPEVDPVTLVGPARGRRLSAGPGDRLRVQCTAIRGYDLVALPLARDAAAE